MASWAGLTFLLCSFFLSSGPRGALCLCSSSCSGVWGLPVGRVCRALEGSCALTLTLPSWPASLRFPPGVPGILHTRLTLHFTGRGTGSRGLWDTIGMWISCSKVSFLVLRWLPGILQRKVMGLYDLLRGVREQNQEGIHPRSVFPEGPKGPPVSSLVAVMVTSGPDRGSGGHGGPFWVY